MRIAIIDIAGILSFLLVFLPVYFLLIVPGDEEMTSDNETMTEETESAAAKTTEKLPLTNPGDAPPPK